MNGNRIAYSGLSLIGATLLVAAVALLFTARYPAGLYDLAVGINRWSYRLGVYVALMTDRYPPFRLDQGGADPEDAAEPGAPREASE
jgi:hypothetical protein